MRDNYLHTDQYPITWYKGKITEIKSTSPSQYNITVAGKIFIHGIEKDLSVTGTMQRSDNTMQIEAIFNVKLTDFEVEVPSIMFYKIDETMELHLDFYVIEVRE
jgi:polyisoprenoid-binding protein YceI